jgi:hypothetical protein
MWFLNEVGSVLIWVILWIVIMYFIWPRIRRTWMNRTKFRSEDDTPNWDNYRH